MKRHRVLRLVALSRAFAVGLAGTFGSVVLVAACASRSNPVGPGGECFLATDCAPGLVCVEQANKVRICSDDLSRVAGRPPPEAGADAADAATEGGLDGASPDGAQPPRDSGGVPDTGTSPDTGAPTDAGGD